MNNELSFFEFTQLPQEEQYHLAFTQGEFIGSSEKGMSKFVLYKLYNFYIEIVYDVTNNTILNLTSYLNS